MTATPTSRMKQLRLMVMIMAGSLAIQFVAGIYTNLFVAIPLQRMHGHSQGLLSGISTMLPMIARRPDLLIHVVLGLLLALFAIATVIVAFKIGRSPATLWAVAGLLFILFAGYGGVTFLMDGQHNNDSFIMAVGWLASFLAYIALIWVTAP